MFFLEAGINHFGKVKDANKILNFFVRSSFVNITFMIHKKSFYNLQKKKQNDFSLPIDFYKKAIKKCRENNKKIGLSVCDEKSFIPLKNLNFNFFKLLSVGISNKKLIEILNKKNKPVYISTGFNASNSKISKCLKLFKNKKKLTILHTPMTYDISKLNFQRINDLKKTYKLDVGYSNHNNDFNTLNILSAYNPKCIFIYCKPYFVKNRVYPDDKHALYLNELNRVKKLYETYKTVNNSISKVYDVDIFKNDPKNK